MARRANSGCGVDARAHRRAAQGQFAQMLFSRPEPLQSVPDLAGVTAEFLSQADGRGVLQVRAPDFEHVVEFRRLLLQRARQFGQGRDQRPLDPFQRRQVNGRRNGVVAGLAAVDVVVGMDQFAAALAAEQFAGPVGDDLVGVHIGRGARAGLENIQHELPVPLAVNDFLRGLGDGLGQFGIQVAQFLVGQRRVFLDQSQRPDEPPRKAQVADGKVLHRARGLRAVISGGGHLHRSHGIGLGAKRFVHAVENAQTLPSMQGD